MVLGVKLPKLSVVYPLRPQSPEKMVSQWGWSSGGEFWKDFPMLSHPPFFLPRSNSCFLASFLVVLELEPRTKCTLSMCSTSELRETGNQYLAQADLKPLILLPPPPEC
jgi:hypothetical protein